MCSDDRLASLRAALAAIAASRPDGEGELALMSLAEARRLAQAHQVDAATVEREAVAMRVLPARYERNLGTLGWEGQARLLAAHVAVVGAGGLGGWVAEALARMGVGRLTIIDGDRYEENNLNRQLGCTEASIGALKAGCLAERLRLVNSAVTVEARCEWLHQENASALLAGIDVVIDALDSLPARRLLQRIAGELGVPMVHGAIAGYTGQVMTILPGDVGLEALYGGARSSLEHGVETQLGNPAATPMMVAAWQVHEAVKLIVGQGTLLRGRLLLLDAEHGDATLIALE